MAETPEAIVEEMLVSNAASPDASILNGAPNGNGRIVVSEPLNADADGDVHMEQPTHVNGHTDTNDAKLSNSFTSYRSPIHVVSPHPIDADVDDEARPPPAKRARKLSDADQASIANVSHSFDPQL